tara:strand:+ start:446 stop:574 length:129 start_codon:yes stop_codon:yes gene_type:complete
MIKKITLTLLLCCILISCGKKGNPEYIDPDSKVNLQTIINKS